MFRNVRSSARDPLLPTSTNGRRGGGHSIYGGTRSSRPDISKSFIATVIWALVSASLVRNGHRFPQVKVRESGGRSCFWERSFRQNRTARFQTQCFCLVVIRNLERLVGRPFDVETDTLSSSSRNTLQHQYCTYILFSLKIVTCELVQGALRWTNLEITRALASYHSIKLDSEQRYGHLRCAIPQHQLCIATSEQVGDIATLTPTSFLRHPIGSFVFHCFDLFEPEWTRSVDVDPFP